MADRAFGRSVQQEVIRLSHLLRGISSLEEALSRLGVPDGDTSAQEPLVTGNVPRIVVWKNTSHIFDVVAYIERDGRFSLRSEEKEARVSET
jgi:hypothetical protein